MSWVVLIIWLQTNRWYHPPCQMLSTQCSGWVSWLIFNEFSSNSTSPDISHHPSSSHGGDFQQFLKNLICLLCSSSSLPLCEKLTKDLHIRNKMQPPILNFTRVWKFYANSIIQRLGCSILSGTWNRLESTFNKSNELSALQYQMYVSDMIQIILQQGCYKKSASLP